MNSTDKKRQPKTTPIKESAPPPRKTVEQLTIEAKNEATELAIGLDQSGTQTDKPKRIRRTKAEMEAANRPQTGNQTNIDPEILKRAWNIPFTLMADLTKNPAWELSSDQAENIALNTKEAIDKYIMPFMGDHAPLYFACISLLSLGIIKAKEVRVWEQAHPKKGKDVRPEQIKSLQFSDEKEPEKVT